MSNLADAIGVESNPVVK